MELVIKPEFKLNEIANRSIYKDRAWTAASIAAREPAATSVPQQELLQQDDVVASATPDKPLSP